MLNKLIVAKLIVAQASKQALMRSPCSEKEFVQAVQTRGNDSSITEEEITHVMNMKIKDLFLFL